MPPIIQRWRENNYTWGAPRSWACFRPDADVLVPMHYQFDPEDVVSPFAGGAEHQHAHEVSILTQVKSHLCSVAPPPGGAVFLHVMSLPDVS